MNKKTTNLAERDGIMVTDMLSELCYQLATLFSSLSNITKTCMGLKDQLRNMSSEEQIEIKEYEKRENLENGEEK